MILFKSLNIKVYLQNNASELVFIAKNKPTYKEWKKAFIVGLQHVKNSYFKKDRPLVKVWINDLTKLIVITGEHQCFLQKYVNSLLQKLNPPLEVQFKEPKNIWGKLSMQLYLANSTFFSCKKDFARFKIS